MPIYKRADSPYYWASGRDAQGRRWKRSTSQTTRAGALAVLRQLEQQYAAPPDRAPYALQDALTLLLEVAARNKRSPATIEIHTDKGRHLLRVLGADRNVDALTLADTERYLDQRRREGASDHTVEKELRTLTQAIRAARRRGLCVLDPVSLKPEALRSVYVPRERWITLDEYPRLRAELERSAPARLDHFEVYLRTGVRWSELYVLEARWLDRHGRRVWCDGAKTLRAKRWLPLDDQGYAILARRALAHPTGPLFPDVWRESNLCRTLTACAARIGRPPLSTNDLRRTYCSWLASAGVPEHVCARLMGHTNSTMVRRVYAQLADATLTAAVATLPRTTYGTALTDTARTRGTERA